MEADNPGLQRPDQRKETEACWSHLGRWPQMRLTQLLLAGCFVATIFRHGNAKASRTTYSLSHRRRSSQERALACRLGGHKNPKIISLTLKNGITEIKMTKA